MPEKQPPVATCGSQQTGPQPTYPDGNTQQANNLAVNEHHNYFVHGVLAHNSQKSGSGGNKIEKASMDEDPELRSP
ncbi:MAG: hypothetical protein HN348_35040 [Proteobacteria bacterium]|jgi:hypothetical protein|nr:hypothetical protein [Pseudomonadota bacterium]